jgi:hypothetical protein
VNNTIHALNIDSSSCNIGGDKCHTFTMLESRHRRISLSLRQAAMQCFNGHTIVLHIIANSIDTVSGSAENNCSTTLPNNF